MISNPVDRAFSNLASVITILRAGATGRSDMINHARVLNSIAEARERLDELELVTLQDKTAKDTEAAKKLADRAKDDARIAIYLQNHPEEAARAARLSEVNVNAPEVLVKTR